MEYICKQCGVTFHDRKRQDRIIKYCSHKCAGIAKRGKPPWNAGTKGIMKPNKASFKKGHVSTCGFKKGAKPVNYKGWSMHSEGYVQIVMRGHPRANKQNRVNRSVLSAEAILKRYLTPKEILHHINEDRTDDRPENLYLFATQSEHISYHSNYRYGNCKRISVSNIRP